MTEGQKIQQKKDKRIYSNYKTLHR